MYRVFSFLFPFRFHSWNASQIVPLSSYKCWREGGVVFRLTQTHFLPKEIVSQGRERNNITLTNFTCVCILHVSIYCPHPALVPPEYTWWELLLHAGQVKGQLHRHAQRWSVSNIAHILVWLLELWTLVELSFREGDGVSVVGFMAGEKRWHPGLYTTHEAFNPSPEWCVGEAGIMYSNYRVAL